MEPTRARVVQVAAAWCLFVLATAMLYAPLFGQDLRAVVPTTAGPNVERRATEWDRRFVVWLVARNAHAWVHHPWRMYDTGTCHPVEDSLALGHPALSVGLLGVPGNLLTGDPIATYNTALILQTLLAAFAMYLLVADWTRDRSAGIAAGLAYAFLQGKAGAINYPFHGDTAWMLLAFFFARRLFAGAGASAALGLAVSTALQLATSFYVALAAACLGAPMLVWLMHAYGFAKLRPLPTGAALLLVAIAAWTIFAPFVEGHGDVLAARQHQNFGSLRLVWALLTGSWVIATLAVLGLIVPRRYSVPSLPSSPRWALAFGAAMAGLLGTSSAAYAALSGLIPGLETVRVPAFLLGGLHLAWCVLAGLGAAGLLRVLGGSQSALPATVLLALVFVDVMRPPLPGLPPRRAYETTSLRPEPAKLAFYEQLDAVGNRGPILEAPIDYRVARHGLEAASQSVLLQAYHRRRTSACYNSFVPDAVRELGPLAERLPEAGALKAITERGFTTLIVRSSFQPGDRAWQRQIARASEQDRGLTPILSGGGFSAYLLRADPP